MSNFKLALKRVLEHEGGYVNHPSDPGGETNFGITKATAKAFGYNGSMKNIPMSVVEDIYKKQFWDKIKADNFPLVFAFQYFDAAVNHGIGNANKMLQRAVGVKDDGAVGPVTLNAVEKYSSHQLASKFLSKRVSFYTSLKTFNTFGKGWMNRVAINLQHLAQDQA